MKKIASLATLAASLLFFAGSASAATTWFVSPTGNDSNSCTTSGSACLTVQGAVNKASAGDTIDVAAGTYSGNIILPTGLNNLTIQGSGSVVFNLASGYGVNLDNGYAVIGFTLSGFTFNSTSGTTYAFKAYKADHLTLTNDTFTGNGFGGGIDVNTTSHVVFNNVVSSGFHKNGFAITAAYTVADESTPSSDVKFNGITASNNGWNGISFYTIGNDHSPSSIGGSASISGVQFTGSNTISGNTSAGLFIEGNSDANFGAFANPVNTVTTNGTTLDLSDIAFSGNPHYDIVNYQSAPVDGLSATFGGLTGDQMTTSQQTTENGMIIDQRTHANLGLVTYYHTPSVTTDAATNVTTSDATMNATNGPVAAGMESFWVSTSTINTSSPTIPQGVYSTLVLPAVGAGTAFSDTLSSLTQPNGAYVHGQVHGSMPAIQPGTTYYYVAWVNVNGTWYPGNQESVTISLPTYSVTIDKYLDGKMATASSANSAAFPMVSSWNAANLGGASSGSYSLSPTGFNSPNPYEAITSPMDQGSSYATNEVTTGNTVAGSSCGHKVGTKLVGYTWGTSLSAAQSMHVSKTAPSFTNLTQNEFVIVWNKTCPASQITVTNDNQAFVITDTSASSNSGGNTVGNSGGNGGNHDGGSTGGNNSVVTGNSSSNASSFTILNTNYTNIKGF